MKSENVILSSYNMLSLFPSQVNLLNELNIVNSSFNHPIGITIPYKDILAMTAHQLIKFDESVQNARYPINVPIVDGLEAEGPDGSES